MGCCPADEKWRPLFGGSDGRTPDGNGACVDEHTSGEDPGDPRGEVGDVPPLGVSTPAQEVTGALSLESPIAGTEQTSPPSPGDPQRPSRELAELDFHLGFLLRDQSIASELPVGRVPTEPLNHVEGEATGPGDSLLQICPNPRPLPKLLPCSQEQPPSEGPQPCQRPDSTDGNPGICLPPDDSYLCFAAKSHRDISASLRVATSLGFASMNESETPRAGLEQCSCQLSYATCFRGLQLDPEEDAKDLEAPPTVPLTSPPAAGRQLALPWRPVQAHSSDPEPLCRNSPIWPEYCSRALRQLKATPASTHEGFVHLTESLQELRHILETSGAHGHKHPPEKCTWHFSENRGRLCMGSQKLLSSCQHVIRMDQSPEEMQGALRDTFQHLVQLAGLCLQLTDCSRCSARHQEATGHLRDVVHNYQQFVEAAKLTCERGYHDLSVKLLARQCTALTAAVFCLNQKFRASPAL